MWVRTFAALILYEVTGAHPVRYDAALLCSGVKSGTIPARLDAPVEFLTG
jgi:hypothetical protein